MNKSLEERFWEKVDKKGPDDCWNWLAGKSGAGYGTFWAWGRNRGAHRVAWRLTQGEIPDGLCICHHCDNPLCCNLNHLFLGTRADNNHDMIAKGRAASGADSNSGKRKLTEEEVLEIRQRYTNGDITQRELAQDYPVGQSQICLVVNQKRWRYI